MAIVHGYVQLQEGRMLSERLKKFSIRGLVWRTVQWLRIVRESWDFMEYVGCPLTYPLVI